MFLPDVSYCILSITMTSQWARKRLKSPASRLFTQLFIQTQMNENIKAPRHWPLCGEFTVDRWIPLTKAIDAENVSIWWRHDGYKWHWLDLCHLQIELHRNVSYRLKLPSIRLLNSRVIRKLCTHISLFRDISHMPHHVYVTRTSWRLKSAASILFVQQIVKANRKKLHHTGSLYGECTGDRLTGRFPSQRVNNTESVSMSWRHHVLQLIEAQSTSRMGLPDGNL